MPVRNIDEIFVPANRMRKEIDPKVLEPLIESILSVGLLHPPVVEVDGALLAGERRFRALQELARRGETYHCNGKFIRPGLIYTTDIRELTPAGRLQAEFDENEIRLALTWQEKAEAVARLHEYRNAQKETATLPGVEPEPQSPAETAAEFRQIPLEQVTRAAVEDIKKDLLVTTWLDSHPDDTEVANAKSRSDALRSIEKTLEREHQAALAKRFLRTHSTSSHIVRREDMRIILPKTPAETYDCIVTDPPWGVGANTWQNGTSVRQHAYIDDLTTYESIHNCLAIEGYRVAKERAHLYCFCASQKFEDLRKKFLAAGWDVWPRPLIWWHPTTGLPPRPEHGPRNSYECILYAIKGNRRVTFMRDDVIVCAKPHLDNRAAEKPVAIYFELLRRTCLPGNEVLDPCCGAGAIFPAASALKLKATGYDTDEEAINLSLVRVDEPYSHTEMRMAASI